MNCISEKTTLYKISYTARSFGHNGLFPGRNNMIILKSSQSNQNAANQQLQNNKIQFNI